MRKFFCFVGLCALAILATSCGATKVINSATYTAGAAKLYVTPLQADLNVSPKKINYFMPVSESVGRGGLDNVIATAIKEALDANGGDVIVGLETSVAYHPDGSFESISITGYPASYVNFRNNENLPVVEAVSVVKASQPEESLLGKTLKALKRLKK